MNRNRLKALLPRIGLVVVGVVIGLLARQIIGPPDEGDRPKLTIDRPIGKDLDLDPEQAGYVPVELPLADWPDENSLP